MPSVVPPHVIERLCSFLRNELASAAGCRAARSRAAQSYAGELGECETSHEVRASLLGERILRLGGEPPDSPPLRSALERTVKATIEALSGRTTLALLEANEDERLDDYQTKTEDLDDDTRRFISDDILPKQELTRKLIRSLYLAVACHTPAWV